MIKKEKTNKMNLNWNLAIVAVLGLMWAIIPISSMFVEAAGVPILVRNAVLASPTGSVNPHGASEYQLYQSGDRELEVEIEDVNLPDGTVLTAFVDNASVGQMTLSLQRSRLKLKTEDGQQVPTVNAGSTVQVKNGETVLVAGVFGGGPNPTPSPSASPTGSPTGSPSPSPSGSPSPSPTGSPSPSPSPTGTPNGESEIYAILSGATINGVLPRGYAEYEIHSSRTELEIKLRQVSLAAGTSLSVSVQGTAVGTMTMQSGGEARLRLRSDQGANIPVIVPGNNITIKNGDTTILSGTFAGGTSPTPSPSPSGQGRHFEGHLSGGQVTPPVNTLGKGEMNVFLNADETQAQVIGEYSRLSSAQTGTKITVTVGGTTTVIHDFGALGGIERHFTATFNVTANQVQQLRTGLWTAVVSSTNNPTAEIQGAILPDSSLSDFDGDGSNDLSVFRPSNNTFYSLNSNGFGVTVLGSATDKVVSGDYDGDGRTDAAVYRGGIWEIKRSSDGGTTTKQFGLPTDTPVRGDFDGDGRKDLAVFRSQTGDWYIERSSDGGYTIAQFGQQGDIPVASDFDGDGKKDIGVFRPSNGVWYRIESRTGQFKADQFGINGDTPVTGDFDGDGSDDLAVYRSNGEWYVYQSSTGGFYGVQFGTFGDIPVAGDYDGDGKTDIAIFRPSNGYWYIYRSSDSTVDYKNFGLNGDVPTIAR